MIKFFVQFDKSKSSNNWVGSVIECKFTNFILKFTPFIVLSLDRYKSFYILLKK